jgi:hypothetical protein
MVWIRVIGGSPSPPSGQGMSNKTTKRERGGMKMKRFMVWTIALVFLFCTSAIAAEKKAVAPAPGSGVPEAAPAMTSEATKTETGKATGKTKELTPEQKKKADKKAADKKAKTEKRTPDKKKADAALPSTSADTPAAAKTGKISADEAKKAEKRTPDQKKVDAAIPATSNK